MRLIDADELKENISNEIVQKFIRWDKTITVSECETFIRDIIDNAPTVETKTTADCITAYGDGYETARRLYER